MSNITFTIKDRYSYNERNSNQQILDDYLKQHSNITKIKNKYMKQYKDLCTI